MKTVSSLLAKTATSQSQFCECKEMHSEIEALKFGQDTNRMAIQSLSESIARITDVLSQNQEDNDNKCENINNDNEGIFNNLQEPNHEILQYNTFHASEMSNVNDPKVDTTCSQNNICLDNSSLSSSTKESITDPDRDSSILIIGDSIIKHVDPRKISRRKVTKRMFPGKTAEEIKAEVKAIKVKSLPSHIIVHAGTNDLPVDMPNNCIKNIKNLALSIKANFTGSRISLSSITARYDLYGLDQAITVNEQIQKFCTKNDFDYINNNNVDRTCLNGSSLHLNAKGDFFFAMGAKWI